MCTICDGLTIQETPEENAARFFAAGAIVGLDCATDVARAMGAGLFIRVRAEKLFCAKHRDLVLAMFKEAHEALSIPRPPEETPS